jgi:ferritin-like metal-binding protein YciE
MDGLTKEGAEVIEDHAKGCVRDAGLIIAAQKVEHYEISAYGSLRDLAKVMGLEEAAKTLQETLDEEAATDKLLSGLAETINQEAFTETEVMKEEN